MFKPQLPPIVAELQKSTKSLLLGKIAPPSGWKIVLDQRTKDISPEGCIYLTNPDKKVLVKLLVVENKTDENKLGIYYKIESDSSLEKLYKNNELQVAKLEKMFDEPGGVEYFDVLKKGKKEFSLNPKTKKLADILADSTSFTQFMAKTYKEESNFTKEEKADYSSLMTKASLQSLKTGSFNDRKTFHYAPELNILSDLLILDNTKVKELLVQKNFKGFDADLKYFGASVNFLFDKIKEIGATKDNPYYSADSDRFYRFKHKGEEFMYSQSQNSGYLFKKTEDGFEGHIFGSECIRKNLKQLFEAGLGEHSLSLKIDKNHQITYMDTWVDYNAFVLNHAVERVVGDHTGVDQFRNSEEILQSYLDNKLDEIFPPKAESKKKFKKA